MPVTAGLAESNGSLPPGGWLKVTCGLTACTPGSAQDPMLGNECGKTLPLPFSLSSSMVMFSLFCLTNEEQTFYSSLLIATMCLSDVLFMFDIVYIFIILFLSCINVKKPSFYNNV